MTVSSSPWRQRIRHWGMSVCVCLLLGVRLSVCVCIFTCMCAATRFRVRKPGHSRRLYGITRLHCRILAPSERASHHPQPFSLGVCLSFTRLRRADLRYNHPLIQALIRLQSNMSLIACLTLSVEMCWFERMTPSL